MQQQGTQARTLALDSAERFSAAVVTGFVGPAGSAKGRLARLVPGARAEVMSLANLPSVALSQPDGWPTEPTLAAIAASLEAVVVVLNRSVTAAEFDRALPDLASAAVLAVRLCPTQSVVGLDELLPYRPLAKLSRPELESFVRETVGGVLAQPRLERDRLIEALWAQHHHDMDNADVQDRVFALTGLDPARQRDRFRLDLGLHALRLLSCDPSTIGRTPHMTTVYPLESQNSGVRPIFDIAHRSHTTSLFAPHSPQQTVDRVGREEQTK